MPFHGTILLAYAYWIIGPGVAFAVGGLPERIAAIVLWLDLATIALHHDARELTQVQWRMAAGDLAVLAGLVWLAARFDRRWLIWAIAIQIVAVAAHLPRIIDPSVRNWGYLTVTTVIGYALVTVVWIGSVLEARRHERR